MLTSIKDYLSKLIKENKDGIYRLIGAVSVILLFVLLDIECIFRKYLNIPCLGCGMTRAWKALLKGDFGKAFRYHRAYWTVPILFIYIFKGKLIFKKHLWDILIIIFIVILFIENYLYTYIFF